MSVTLGYHSTKLLRKREDQNVIKLSMEVRAPPSKKVHSRKRCPQQRLSMRPTSPEHVHHHTHTLNAKMDSLSVHIIQLKSAPTITIRPQPRSLDVTPHGQPINDLAAARTSADTNTNTSHWRWTHLIHVQGRWSSRWS